MSIVEEGDVTDIEISEALIGVSISL